MAAAKRAAGAPPRTVDQIEAELAGTRDRLVGTVAELEQRLNPQRFVAEQKVRIRAFYVGPEGPRWDHVAITVAAVGAGLLGVRIASRAVHWAFAPPAPPALPEGVVFVPVPRAQLVALESRAALEARAA